MRLSPALALAACFLLAPVSAHAAADVSLYDGGLLITAEDVPNEFVIGMAGENVYRVEDKLVDLTSSDMHCSHPDPANAHVMHCTKDPSQEALVYSLNAAGGDDKVTISGAIASCTCYGIYGMAGNDTIVGGSLYDNISGGDGDDTLTGGLGSDHMYGQNGSDTLQARDGDVDAILDCDSGGNSPDDGANDLAVIDANQLEEAHNCKTVDRAASGGGGGGGGGDDGGGDDGGDDGAESTAVKVKVPKVRPEPLSSQRYRYTHIETLRKQLEKLGVPFRLRAVGVPFKNVDDNYQDTIEDGDIFSQSKSPKPGKEITIDPTKECKKDAAIPCRLEFSVHYYDQADDIKGSKCPYLPRDKNSQKLMRLLRDRTYQDALEILKDHNCRFRIVNYVENPGVIEESIRGATVSFTTRKKSSGGGKERVYFVNLVVDRPIRSDFTVSVLPRPYDDYKNNPGRVDDFERELDLGTDGKLTFASKNPGVVHVIPNENFTARYIKRLTIELVKNPAGRPQDASILASSTTDNAGGVTFTFPVNWTGDLEINIRAQGKRTNEDLVEDTMRGWATIPVVERNASKPLATRSGRYFRFKSGRWTRVDLFVEAMKGFADALRDLNGWTGAEADACRAAVRNDLNSQRAVNTCWKNDIAVTATTNGGTTTGLDRAQAVNAQGFTVQDGRLVQASIPASVVPGTTSVVGAGILSENGTNLISNGVPLINLNGGNILSENGVNITADGRSPAVILEGAKILSQNGTNILSENGTNILSQNGMNLISNKGGGIISDKGAGLLPDR